MHETLNKLNKLSLWGGLLTKIAMILLILGAVFLLILMVVTALNPDVLIDILDNEMAKDDILVVCAAGLAVLAIGLLILYCLDRILDNIREAGTPFTDENVKGLRRIAVLVLIAAIAVPVIGFILVKITDAGSNVMIEFNPFLLFVAVLVYFVSLIFKYGVALQKESDETL
jgi:hypothetical protein